APVFDAAAFGGAAFGGTAFGAAVLEFEQLHRVQVDDGVQPGEVVRVGVAQLAAAVPDVAPADPAARVPLGDERGAVGPHVRQHPGQVGDAPLGQRRDDVRVGA